MEGIGFWYPNMLVSQVEASAPSGGGRWAAAHAFGPPPPSVPDLPISPCSTLHSKPGAYGFHLVQQGLSKSGV